MNFVNKVGSMINKKMSSLKGKKTEPTSYKPAGVHILGEDNMLEDNMIINEDTDPIDDQNNEPQQQSLSDNSLIKVAPKKSISSSMQDIFGITKQEHQQIQKAKQEENLPKEIVLINGEKIMQTEICQIQIDNEQMQAKLHLTNFRIYIIPEFPKKQGEFSYHNYFPEDFFSLLIHKIEKAVRTSNDKSFTFSMEIQMKDLRVMKLIFQNNKAGNTILDRLNGLLSLKETPSFSI